MARGALAAGSGFYIPPPVVAASVPTSPLLRSAFFTSCSSFDRFKSSHFPLRHRLRKCPAQISSSAIPSGMGTELHDSIVHLQVGLLQRMVDLGFSLPANDGALNWLAVAVPAVVWYVAAAPGSLSGVVDYAYAPVHSLSNISFDAEEVQVGKQIGQGSFGIVYEGYIGRGLRKGSQKQELHVILKKVKPRIKGASEMHDAEVHMNRRVQRTAPNACAEFIGTTKVSSSQIRGRLSEGLWLVWRYEGDKTLAHYMQQRNFPENVAQSILGRKISATSKQEIVEQNSAVIRKIATQILICLRDLHKTGLVHRDVKPMNLILAEDLGTFKLVDLGAAVDLRSGYNYVPGETIIDPTYAAPEHHVMPTSSPKLPPDPLCSVVSPLVWLLNTPDRFDLFSAGLVLLQMAVKPLRQDIGLQTFNAEFERAGYDLDVWRRRCRFSDDEFLLLDADDAAGWELVRSMLQPRHYKDFFIWPSLGRSRPSADAALRHRFLTGSFFKLPLFKDLQLPTFSFPIQPSSLVPNFSLDSLPKLETIRAGLDSFSLQASNLIPSFSFDALPKLETIRTGLNSFSLQASNLVPNFGFDTLPQPRAIGTGLDMNTKKVIKTIKAVMPKATTSALTLATGWLVFSALRDLAQTSYAVGHWAMESLGIAGAICLTSFVLSRYFLEAQETKEQNSNTELKLRTSQTPSLAAVDIGESIEDGTIDDLRTGQLQFIKERLTLLAGLDEAVETSDDVHKLPAAGMESPLNDSTFTGLPSRPQTLRLGRTKTGLAEAVQTLELQLASLESSIAAERLFAEQQRQQITQMEKLLNRQPQGAVGATDQSDK